jgi:hypothetical protein
MPSIYSNGEVHLNGSLTIDLSGGLSSVQGGGSVNLIQCGQNGKIHGNFTSVNVVNNYPGGNQTSANAVYNRCVQTSSSGVTYNFNADPSCDPNKEVISSQQESDTESFAHSVWLWVVVAVGAVLSLGLGCILCFCKEALCCACCVGKEIAAIA